MLIRNLACPRRRALPIAALVITRPADVVKVILAAVSATA
jgi:hypothetical protein